jgi:hypothetical protein
MGGLPGGRAETGAEQSDERLRSIVRGCAGWTAAHRPARAAAAAVTVAMALRLSAICSNKSPATGNIDGNTDAKTAVQAAATRTVGRLAEDLLVVRSAAAERP